MIAGATVWSWDCDAYFHLSPAQRAAADAFVRAHGVAPDTVIVGNTVRVVDAADGSGFWFHTWRAVRDADGGRLLRCPHCPACVQQVEVTVQLAVPPPALPDAWLAPGCGLRATQIDDDAQSQA